jgi:hypothetical protein
VVLPAIPGCATHRRYLVVDVEAGLVTGFGTVAQDFLSFSMLKLIDGKIRFIDMLMGPTSDSPGWD